MADDMNVMPLLLVAVGMPLAIYVFSKDNTPVGLVVTNIIGPISGLGTTTDGKELTARFVEGTWRVDEGSVPVASVSSEKPLMVVYEDGEAVYAEVTTYAYFDPDERVDECENPPDSESDEFEGWDAKCQLAGAKFSEDMNLAWRDMGLKRGATSESLDKYYPLDDTTAIIQEAESWLGLTTNNMFINTLQSHNAF